MCVRYTVAAARGTIYVIVLKNSFASEFCTSVIHHRLFFAAPKPILTPVDCQSGIEGGVKRLPCLHFTVALNCTVQEQPGLVSVLRCKGILQLTAARQ